MYGDYSRDSFDRTKYYRRVLMQQGRPLTDADWNEMETLALQRERLLLKSLLGYSHGTFDCGFSLASKPKFKLNLRAGSYYVDGLRCDYPGTTEFDVALTEVQKAQFPLFLYLEAWERTVTSLEDPALLEPSLSGTDTALRSKVDWAVRLRGLPQDSFQKSCPVDGPSIWSMMEICQPKDRTISVRRTGSSDAADPVCGSRAAVVPSTNANTLYRIEVHQTGKPYRIDDDINKDLLKSATTFKWSRENGAGVFAINETLLSGADGGLTLKDGGVNARVTLKEGDSVELFDQLGRPANEGRRLVTVINATEKSRVQLSSNLKGVKDDDADVVFASDPFQPKGNIPGQCSTQYFLRRWSQSGQSLSVDASGNCTTSDPQIPSPCNFVREQSRAGKITMTPEGTALAVANDVGMEPLWLELEPGIQISFDPKRRTQPATIGSCERHPNRQTDFFRRELPAKVILLARFHLADGSELRL